MSSDPKKCFVISPIGANDSQIRKNANLLFETIIITITKKYGYETLRSDTNDKFGQITREIFKEISTSDLIIADLTCLNPNVLYELGICHTIDKPTILMKNKIDNKPLPFDTKNHNTIIYEFNDLEKDKSRLEDQIIKIENDNSSYNPIDFVLRSEILSAMFNNFYNMMEKVTETMNKLNSLANNENRYSFQNGDDYYAKIEAVKEVIKLREDIKNILHINKNN
jgi:hypothetical protein